MSTTKAAQSTKYRKIDALAVSELCDLVRKGLSTEHACAITGCSAGTVASKTSRAEKEESEQKIDFVLAEGLARARAECVQTLLSELWDTQRGGRIKALHMLLRALDGRFKDEVVVGAGGILIINGVVPRPDYGQATMHTVVVPKAFPEGGDNDDYVKPPLLEGSGAGQIDSSEIPSSQASEGGEGAGAEGPNP